MKIQVLPYRVVKSFVCECGHETLQLGKTKPKCCTNPKCGRRFDAS